MHLSSFSKYTPFLALVRPRAWFVPGTAGMAMPVIFCSSFHRDHMGPRVTIRLYYMSLKPKPVAFLLTLPVLWLFSCHPSLVGIYASVASCHRSEDLGLLLGADSQSVLGVFCLGYFLLCVCFLAHTISKNPQAWLFGSSFLCHYIQAPDWCK